MQVILNEISPAVFPSVWWKISSQIKSLLAKQQQSAIDFVMAEYKKCSLGKGAKGRFS